MWDAGYIAATVACNLAIVWYSIRRKSLTTSGLVAAFCVGMVTMLCSVPHMVTLLFFFVSSSRLTKVGAARKTKIEDGYSVTHGRTAIQVLSNGGFPTLVAGMRVWFAYAYGYTHDPHVALIAMDVAFVGAYATCCGDTWASELGILSPTKPRLITTMKTVPPGTNGGLTGVGLAASAAGGFCTGLAYFVSAALTDHSTAAAWWGMLVVGTVGGFVGSLIDSLLGATMQESRLNEKGQIMEDVRVTVTNHGRKAAHESTHVAGYDMLDNHQVNLVSSVATSLAVTFGYAFFTS